MIQRLDELTGPVEVGRYYLVPTVRGEWKGYVRDWPVIGPRHNDAQCLKFEHQHYHLDGRFLSEPREMFWDFVGFWRHVGGSPLSLDEKGNCAEMPAPVWRRRLCRHAVSPSVAEIGPLAAQDRSSGRWKCHFDQWTGKQARHDGRGWVCPHRSVALADHAAIDGVIICPLHLLRIDAATGVVLPPLAREAVPA